MKFNLFLGFCLVAFGLFSQAPTANFSASPLSVCLGAPINFTNSSTPGSSPIVNWSWDFGDGNSSTLVNPSHTYTTAGTYTVTLVVTAQNGQADAEVKSMYVTVNPLPTVGFTASGNGCTVPFNVSFTNTSQSGPGISYAWNFGNGQTSTQQNPVAVTYATAGTFTVTLTVTNTNTGCTNSFSQTLVVSDFSAGISAPLQACVGQSVVCTDASTVGANSWNWNFGDGGTSTAQNPTHTYAAPGTYTITLNAQNTVSGCSDAVTKNITVNPLPVPSFTAAVTSGCAPLAVNFVNTSGAGTTFNWDFGNGSTFTGTNPLAQSYNASGSYTVTLTMTNANGCTGTTTLTNYITVQDPIAQFNMDVFNGCDPVVVQFTDASVPPSSSDPLVSWQWDFGDGSLPFNGQVPPAHSYSVGVYSVTLTVTSQNGCQASVTYVDTIQVGSILNVDFLVDPMIECAKTAIDFTDLTTFNGTPDPGEVLYFWDFGDGGTSTQQNPTYSYPSDTGYFDVTLIVSWRGCMDTLILPNAVYIKAPISIFNPVQTLFCNPASFPVNVGVTDNSIIGVYPDDVDMIWDWGDGSFTYFDDPDIEDPDKGSTTHNYSAYGTYTIEQVIHNYTTGCSDSTTQTIHISQTIADFTLSNDSSCVGSPVTLTSTSTSTHPFGTYNYTMGNGATISGSPASYAYPNFGAYTITLVATNNVGCSDNEVFIGFDALALPSAAITPSATTGCAPIPVVYTNSSSVVGNGVPLSSYFWTFPDLSTQTTTNLATTTNYTFTTEGSFTTTLVTTDQFGCVSPATSVNMLITKPTASFTVDSVVCDLEAFTTVNSSIGGTSYQWFIDGQPGGNTSDLSSSFDEVSSASYNSVSHVIGLIVTDVNGCMDTLEQAMIVSMPYADFDFDLTGANINANNEFTCPPVFADFTDQSNTYDGISNWNWDFGDGKFSSLQDPGNTYVFAGTYTASLSVTDVYGCVDDTVLLDFLSISGPSGNPFWTPVGDLCGQTYNFDATNLSNVDHIIWNLDDDSTVNSLTGFEHTYLAVDTYNPTAILIDSLGCEVIYPLPEIVIPDNGLNAFFEASPPIGSMGTTFFLDQGSTYTGAPIVAWDWTLNGVLLENTTPDDVFQQYGFPGTYPISLMVTDANGCVDLYSLNVLITDEFVMPNIITANNDGVNDLFTLPAAIFKSFDIVIVNRWGDVIHEETNATGTLMWNGLTDSGNAVNDGVYFYKLIGIFYDGSNVLRHGNITVVHQ